MSAPAAPADVTALEDPNQIPEGGIAASGASAVPAEYPEQVPEGGIAVSSTSNSVIPLPKLELEDRVEGFPWPPDSALAFVDIQGEEQLSGIRSSVSLVRSNAKRRLDDVDEIRRINFLLTRARRGLVVIRDKDTLNYG